MDTKEKIDDMIEIEGKEPFTDISLIKTYEN